MRKIFAAALAGAAAAAFILPAQAAGSASNELAECLHSNATSQDKQTLLQWAYVTLSRTSAAKQVQAIPQDKVKSVESKAQQSLTRLVLNRCSKPAMKLAFSDPKNGLQDSLTALAKKLVDDEISKRSSPLLSMTITDLLAK